MKKLSVCILFAAGFTCAMAPALAEDAAAPAKSAAQKTAKKTTSKNSRANREEQPDIKGLLPTAFDCELGNKLTIYSDAMDDQQITLQWNKYLHKMTRVSTTTGAQRFENAKNGLVWIGIPAKGMLLDSKKGKQLANECKNSEQQLLPQKVVENS